MTTQILNGDALTMLRSLPANSIHCCVTSPPYFRLRDYGVDGQIGLEQTPEAYVEALVEVFREVRRVLRDDGTCWLNLGDSYVGATSQHYGGASQGHNSVIAKGTYASVPTAGRKNRNKALYESGFQMKQLIGIPWRVAFALQADGWWLRSDIIWAKGNPMPESVTDRPTKAHEYVFLLAKSASYYYDAAAIAEPLSYPNETRRPLGSKGAWKLDGREQRANGGGSPYDGYPSQRNKRTVWNVNTAPFSGAHFATFPPKLIEPMILAGCPATVCAVCGAPYVRITESQSGRSYEDAVNGVSSVTVDPPRRKGLTKHEEATGRTGNVAYDDPLHRKAYKVTQTLGFLPTCTCNGDTRPGVVLDPFAGSGTVGAVAARHNRDSVLIELNPDYIPLIHERLSGVTPLIPGFGPDQMT